LTPLASIANDEEDASRQWGLGSKHHWTGDDSTIYRGTSTTYSTIGDVLLTKPQTFVYKRAGKNLVNQELQLCLSYAGSRVRCTFVHAPAWEKGKPETGLPDGLRFLRCTVVKESSTLPNFDRSEEVGGDEPDPEKAYFFRPTPPFEWQYIHKGTSWTWGPTKGDEGWALPSVEEADAWHSRPRGDGPNVWSLRLGSILLQCPDFLPRGTNVSVLDTLFRLAWIPNPHRMLRAEASVIAMREIEMESEEGVRVGRPERGSFRVDVLEKVGEPESQLEKEQQH
ncbi:hypothetical protein TrRE_jg6235, partial [Triparma retinervis]